MPDWIQHLLIAIITIACLAFIARQAFKTLTLRRGKLGACCAKGCDAGEKPAEASTQSKRVQFMPLEMLARKRSR